MCPVCITTGVLTAAGATSGAGAMALAASKWRAVLRWCSYWRGRCERIVFHRSAGESE
jgi:hypothetical protein